MDDEPRSELAKKFFSDVPGPPVPKPRRRRAFSAAERRDHHRRKVIVHTLEAMDTQERLVFVRYLYDRYWR